ncbi:MAG: hypothetical protein FJX34_02235 [Alphaproteobacteria bacterium]|nr:hypothetical protein [Alphaproteobacteria bacterium]
MLIRTLLLLLLSGCKILEKGSVPSPKSYGAKCSYRIYQPDEDSGCNYKLSPVNPTQNQQKQ